MPSMSKMSLSCIGKTTGNQDIISPAIFQPDCSGATILQDTRPEDSGGGQVATREKELL